MLVVLEFGWQITTVRHVSRALPSAVMPPDRIANLNVTQYQD